MNKFINSSKFGDELLFISNLVSNQRCFAGSDLLAVQLAVQLAGQLLVELAVQLAVQLAVELAMELAVQLAAQLAVRNHRSEASFWLRYVTNLGESF